ncbi:unnamed protein product [Psylliodes chrysocephalus]|uniref:Major facilitator superfamily (MFS) profile domain-containing protein n=1 Tax=Psylliodes chrysocephalus TaxID=3402493 RepID=A0A9P0CRG8_9CUCU|nr:unnamed protein product [Psylliodes chrysocephala]
MSNLSSKIYLPNTKTVYFISVNVFSFIIGCLLAWNSPVLIQLQSNNTDINPIGRPITTLEVSICTSILPMGSTIGTLLVGKLADIFGRKRMLICLAAGGAVSFGAISIATHIYVYLIFTTTAMVCISAGFVVVPVYVTEIAEDKNRGKLGCFSSIFICLGQLYIYVLGTVTNLAYMSLLCGFPLLLFLIVSVFLPESPIFLASKGNKTEALVALKKLRRNKSFIDLNREYNEKETMLDSTSKEEIKDIRVLFKTRSGKKAVILSIGIRLTQQLSGMFIVLSFLGPLFKETGSSLSIDALTIIVAAANIPVAILALSIIEKKGRRLLLLLAIFFDGLSMFILGLYFLFKENTLIIIPDSVKLIPVVAIFIFVCMFTFGLSNVPFIVISEILPNEVRSVGSSLVLVTGNLSNFFIGFMYPLVSSLVGQYACMFAFSLFCFTGFVFIYFLLPETKGKNFLEIQRELEK